MERMGRPLRLDAPGCWHHVMNRGAGRRIVFRDDRERACFVALLAELDSRFSVEVHAFCLMGNHYHGVFRSAEARLSEAMAWLGSQFTRYVNEQREVDGAIFRGRFHSVSIERDAHLDWLYGYVNANPVDLGWQHRLADYSWSGHATTLGERKDQPWVHTEYYRDRFGNESRRLDAFVESAGRKNCVRRVMDPGPDIVDIRSAVALARGLGPEVNSDAEARATLTVVGLRSGIEPGALVSGLSAQSADAYIRRAQVAVESRHSLAELVRRTEAILDHCAASQPSGA